MWIVQRYGIEEKYIIQGPAVYLIAYDGRLLMRSPEGCHYNVRVNEATSLVDPNITQGGNAQVCSPPYVLQHVDG